VPTAEWTPELTQWLRTLALEAGFDTAGIAPVGDQTSPRSSDHLTAERFSSWIAAGRAGEMDYLKRRDDSGILLRSEVRVAIPWARSVIVCAFNYNTAAPRSIDPAPNTTGWIARYAWSGRQIPDTNNPEHPIQLQPSDYHDDLLHRLRHIETALQQRTPCETRCYVDTGPLVERAAAAQAGIGWIGKNTCVLDQHLGSWLLLGVIITSLPVASDALPQIAADRCGTCTRCIDACPTSALIAPREMDASLCIAYLTIEKKGIIPEHLREPIGRQVFGCDICQDVCPWNRRAPTNQTMLARPQLVNPALDWLAHMDAADFKQWFKGSPLERTRRARLHRNVAIAMGNSGEQRFLPQLRQWATSGDPILAEAAEWSVHRIARLNAESSPHDLSEPTSL
jgi:epoxyqueuosine reductase